jgi:peptidoglycan/LPS O-acetylase OafA/YrhL
VFPLIDILRGFAALSVVVFHVIAHFDWTTFPIEGPLLWFRVGSMGVDLFFVISGFVIALSAFARLTQGDYRTFAHSFARANCTHRAAVLSHMPGLYCVRRTCAGV